MTTGQTALSEIYQFRAVGEKIGTAGQPTESQLRMVREAGFQVVVNLALPTSDNALANEGSLVTGLGMSYVHIPVDFKAPTDGDFQAFCRVMEAFDDRPVFVHCAANMRVSAFVFLYRVLRQRAPVSEAESDLHAIWQLDEVWTRFIHDQLINSIQVRREDITSATATALILALNAETSARYPEEGACHFQLDPNEVAEGTGAFMVAFSRGQPIGCGAVRKLDADTAEFKRMYVTPEARGRKVGRAIVMALEAESRRLGVTRIVLETGVRQPEALALYAATGFERIPAFGDYVGCPLSICMAKKLR
jgi:putative acetyltransferase